MNIPDTMIESAINPKDVRPQIRAPYLDTANGRLIATDGAVAAVVPVFTTDEDHPGFVPVEAFKRGRKMKLTGDCVNALTLNSAACFADGTQLPRQEYDGRSESVACALDGMITRARDSRGERAPDIVIDVKVLLCLAEALNRTDARAKRGLRIWLQHNDDGTIDYRAPLYCEPTHGPDGAHGLCMPMAR